MRYFLSAVLLSLLLSPVFVQAAPSELLASEEISGATLEQAIVLLYELGVLDETTLQQVWSRLVQIEEASILAEAEVVTSKEVLGIQDEATENEAAQTNQDFAFVAKPGVLASLCSETTGDVEILTHITAQLETGERAEIPLLATLKDALTEEVVYQETEIITAVGYQDSGYWENGVKYAFSALEYAGAYELTLSLNPEETYLEVNTGNNEWRMTFSVADLLKNQAVCTIR